jgi:monoamine oxidase
MSSPGHVVVIGAGAAGLMAGRTLAQAGCRATVLEARRRLGGRIWALPEEEFGYRAEGGPEFVHGAAPVTRRLAREAGLGWYPRRGARWAVRGGVWATTTWDPPHADRFRQALEALRHDLPVSAFLATYFAGDEYAELRRSVARMTEGYDAADVTRASTFAVREEWIGRDAPSEGRLKDGYCALIDYLAADCRKHGGEIRLGAEVTAIEPRDGRVVVRTREGSAIDGDAAILTVPLPLLYEIELPASLRERTRAAIDIGYGNVVKLLFRFRDRWWAQHDGKDLSDLAFLLTDAKVPTWWTQHPAPHAVMTGWYSGLKADGLAGLSEAELIDMGVGSLARVFGRPAEELKAKLVCARAINWGLDPFARGAYSYATPRTDAAQLALNQPADGVFISGEALYTGVDRGTVEAALAHGEETALKILGPARI